MLRKNWPSVLFVLVLGTLLVFTVTGCGGSSYHVKSINGHYDVVRIPYQGRSVTCIRSHFNGSQNNAWGGISCDWVAFHKGQ